MNRTPEAAPLGSLIMALGGHYGFCQGWYKLEIPRCFGIYRDKDRKDPILTREKQTRSEQREAARAKAKALDPTQPLNERAMAYWPRIIKAKRASANDLGRYGAARSSAWKAR